MYERIEDFEDKNNFNLKDNFKDNLKDNLKDNYNSIPVTDLEKSKLAEIYLQ